MDSIDVKRRFDHESAKRILKEKYEAKMLFSAYDGMWKAGPELLNIINASMSESNNEIYLPDEYGNPCKVNGTELYRMAKERWQEQMNAWYNEYSELQKKR